jgi:hypothetical protein
VAAAHHHHHGDGAAATAPRRTTPRPSWVGHLALLGYVVALAWTVAAIIMTRRSRVTPTDVAAAT